MSITQTHVGDLKIYYFTHAWKGQGSCEKENKISHVGAHSGYDD